TPGIYALRRQFVCLLSWPDARPPDLPALLGARAAGLRLLDRADQHREHRRAAGGLLSLGRTLPAARPGVRPARLQRGPRALPAAGGAEPERGAAAALRRPGRALRRRDRPCAVRPAAEDVPAAAQRFVYRALPCGYLCGNVRWSPIGN